MGEVSFAEVGFAENSITEVGIAKISITKVSFAKVGITENSQRACLIRHIAVEVARPNSPSRLQFKPLSILGTA